MCLDSLKQEFKYCGTGSCCILVGTIRHDVRFIAPMCTGHKNICLRHIMIWNICFFYTNISLLLIIYFYQIFCTLLRWLLVTFKEKMTLSHAIGTGSYRTSIVLAVRDGKHGTCWWALKTLVQSESHLIKVSCVASHLSPQTILVGFLVVNAINDSMFTNNHKIWLNSIFLQNFITS